MEIREIDPTDDAALRVWWEVGHGAHEERPPDAWPSWEVARARYSSPSPERRTTLLVARDGEEPVGAAILMFPVHDNPHLAYAEAWVPPEHRRRGVGTALAVEMEARTVADGREVVLAEATTRPGERSAGQDFAERLGYAVANRERIKTCSLADTRDRWPALQAEADAALGDYRIESWDTFGPDARLLSGFYAEIPTGDMALEDSEWTPERLNAAYERMASTGSHLFAAAAVAPDGTVVGLSDLRVDEASPATGFVGVTIVESAHRGHRLGLSMKLAVARRAVETLPACERITTGNAETNEQMSAINDRLGFVHGEDLLEMQRRLLG